MSYIKISQLDPISSITGSDFFPLDQSSSLLTKRGNIDQLKTYLSTGSFSGSFSGSFVGIGTSPQFVGTASWAQKSISSSYATASTSASYALTASYAANGGSGGVGGSGTVNYATLWATTTTLKDSELSTDGTTYSLNGRNFTLTSGNITVTGSSNAGVIVQTPSGYSNSDAYLALQSTGKASLYLYNNNRATTYPDQDLWTIQVGGSGSMLWLVPSGSTQLRPLTGSYSANDYYVMKALRNDLYFFPYPSSETPARDAKFGIGIQPPTDHLTSSYLRARLHINTWTSGSSDYPNAVVTNNLPGIIVTAHSLTDTDVFCVSSSGQVTANGYSGSNFSTVSFYGSASYALTASKLSGNGTNPLGILSTTSPNTADTYKGSYFQYGHGLTSTPFYFKAVLICNDAGGDAGYSQNDEIDSVAEYDSVATNEHTAITSWTNSTYIGVSCLNSNWNTNNKSTGASTAVDPSKWKFKFYYR